MSAAEYQQLLPSPGYETPIGDGRALLKDPFTPNGYLLGVDNANSGEAWSHSITRITPADPDWENFVVEGLDSGLKIANRFVYNPNDAVYAAGAGYASGSTLQQWKVRSSSAANPNVWVDEDTTFFMAMQGKGRKQTTVQQMSRAYGMTTDAVAGNPGNVYVCGSASDGSTAYWVIRRKSKGSPAGSGWQTVHSVKSLDNYSRPYSMCFFPGKASDPLPAVLVVGHFNSKWTILRSEDGFNWPEVTEPWPASGEMASAFDAVCDSRGDIYVSGVRGRDGANAGWVLRKSEDGGKTWTTLLDKPSTTPTTWLSGVAVDDNQNITLIGNIASAVGNRWAVVRKTPLQSWEESWANSHFPLGDIRSSGQDPLPLADGSVLMTGRIQEQTSSGTFITRIGLLRMIP